MQTMEYRRPAGGDGKVIDLERFRRGREALSAPAEPVWDGLLWARAGSEAPAAGRAGGRRLELLAWALDAGASVGVAAAAVAFLLQALRL